jgi:hypothetical protein
VGIVQALTLLRLPGVQQQDDVDDVDSVGGFAFDEIRVLPVYRHTYAVSDVTERVVSIEACILQLS